MREIDAVDQGVQHGLSIEFYFSVLLYHHPGEEQFRKLARPVDCANMIYILVRTIASRYSKIIKGQKILVVSP